jgi:hypothetical protein
MKFVCFLIVVGLLSSCSRESKPQNQVAASFHAEELPQGFKLDLSQRKVFPYSVVPGGTVTREEAKARAAADPVVGKHYQGILFDKLKPFRLTKPAQGYVSYRIGNRIFWTAKRLYLKPGEILLSDGANLIRGRCGNRVSLVAQLPQLAAGEPKEAVMDLPSWDHPVFLAMAQEANRGDLFTLPGYANAPAPTLDAKISDSAFTVAPPVVGAPGTGMIGGGLPGGLTPTDRGGELILYTGAPFLLIPGRTINNGITNIILPSITPIEISVLNFPFVFLQSGPIGFGSPIITLLDVPLIPALPILPSFNPLQFFPPSFSLSSGSPPILIAALDPVVPPIESNRPPDNTSPPTEPPPVFQPIPEPATVWMVGLAAVLLLGSRIKRKL